MKNKKPSKVLVKPGKHWQPYMPDHLIQRAQLFGAMTRAVQIDSSRWGPRLAIQC